jgi:hypothetical protein
METIRIARGIGDGRFEPAFEIGLFASASEPTSVFSPNLLAAGDFNRDGRLDIATVDASGAISVLIQRR